MIDVFILHWNRPHECLKTIEAFKSASLPLRITVIDNNSTPDSLNILSESLPPGVALIRRLQNLGWGGGFNPSLETWIADGSTDYAFVAAHDALPQGECLQQLVEAMDRDHKIGIASPGDDKFMLPVFSPIRGTRLVPGDPRAPGTVEAFPFVHGTLMLFRRQCLSELGVFDTRYFAYGDELEICLRANRKRWKTANVWGAIVVNPGSWTPTPLMAYLWARSSLINARQYGGWIAAAARSVAMLLLTGYYALAGRGADSLSAARPRWFAIRDFWLSRFGAPPPNFIESLSKD